MTIEIQKDSRLYRSLSRLMSKEFGLCNEAEVETALSKAKHLRAATGAGFFTAIHIVATTAGAAIGWTIGRTMLCGAIIASVSSGLMFYMMRRPSSSWGHVDWIRLQSCLQAATMFALGCHFSITSAIALYALSGVASYVGISLTDSRDQARLNEFGNL